MYTSAWKSHPANHVGGVNTRMKHYRCQNGEDFVCHDVLSMYLTIIIHTSSRFIFHCMNLIACKLTYIHRALPTIQEKVEAKLPDKSVFNMFINLMLQNPL